MQITVAAVACYSKLSAMFFQLIILKFIHSSFDYDAKAAEKI